jgi:hypothetical protein
MVDGLHVCFSVMHAPGLLQEAQRASHRPPGALQRQVVLGSVGRVIGVVRPADDQQTLEYCCSVKHEKNRSEARTVE